LATKAFDTSKNMQNVVKCLEIVVICCMMKNERNSAALLCYYREDA